MKPMTWARGPFAALCTLVLAFSWVAAARADYPERPVVVQMPFGSGGATQVLLDRLGREMQREAGATLVPNFQGGAGGTIAAQTTASAAPDGYNLLLGSTGALAIGPAVVKVRFDPIKDFTPIVLIASTAYVMVVNARLPIRNVQELIEYAKAHPGKLNFGSTSVGSTDHIMWEIFMKQASVSLTHIPYKGMAVLVPDLLAGRTDVAYMSPIVAQPHVESGALRAIAVSSKIRSPALPTVATVAEQGLPTYDLRAWYGFLGPANTPPAVVSRINALTNSALTRKEIQDYFAAQGLTAGGGTPEQFAAFLKREVTDWGAAVRANGITPQ